MLFFTPFKIIQIYGVFHITKNKKYFRKITKCKVSIFGSKSQKISDFGSEINFCSCAHFCAKRTEMPALTPDLNFPAEELANYC